MFRRARRILSDCHGFVTLAAEGGIQNNAITKSISTLLAGKQNILLAKSDFSSISEELQALYQATHDDLIWLDANHSKEQLNAALDLLTNADSQGLDPSDYDVNSLSNFLKKVSPDESADANKLAAYDTAVSIALLRFAHDLYDGRIRPQDIGYPGKFGRKSALNMTEIIKQLIDQGNLAALPQTLEPKIKQYQRLKQSLAEFRRQPKESAFQPLQFEKPLKPGDSFSQLDALKNRLIALQVITAEKAVTNNPGGVYGDQLLEGVKNLQQKYDLKDDGIIGQETATLLNQTQAEKINRIELAMERLRWLPDTIDGPLLFVNIPAFQLWAFNSLDEQHVLSMKVIVGKANQNQTPVLFEDMQYLEFKPYWNIPQSILDKEIIPKLMDNLTYLQDQDIELVQRFADDSESVEDIFDDLTQGRIRARQRPGNKNPLGKVKFIFPNKEDVYLHDTPSHNLFNRSRRDFSHGCVRVADAEKLAEFVLSHQPGWDSVAIQQAMNSDRTQRVALRHSIPVLFFYTTSFVDQDNRVHFYQDIYGQDAILQKALTKHPGQTRETGNLITSKNAVAG